MIHNRWLKIFKSGLILFPRVYVKVSGSFFLLKSRLSVI